MVVVEEVVIEEEVVAKAEVRVKVADNQEEEIMMKIPQRIVKAKMRVSRRHRESQRENLEHLKDQAVVDLKDQEEEVDVEIQEVMIPEVVEVLA